MSSTPREHTQHYAPGNTAAAVEATLTALGKENSLLTVAELAGMDQFHSGGVEATRMLAERARITASDRVLDVGGGLGGAARVLAQEIGCDVTVIDLTEAYCHIGEKLTERADLSNRVHFHHGNATDLPFEDGSFDVVWTQHSSMNIAEKTQLYAQIHRVLRSGGRLALHEVIVGSGEPLHFPVPWARSEATSFLQPQNAFRAAIVNAGFHQMEWQDLSTWTIAWFQERLKGQQNMPPGPSTLGLHLLVGSDVGIMSRNFAINVQEGRIHLIQGIFERI